MPDTEAYEEPLAVQVCDGEVVLSTPNGPFGVSLTASAAARTAENLAEAARRALGGQASQLTGARD